MVKKVSLLELTTAVNHFEGTLRDQLGDAPGVEEVLLRINTIRQALNEIRERSSSSDLQEMSDHIFCGAAPEQA